MKKNTLFVSVLAGLGSLLAVFAVLNSSGDAQYSPRETATKSNASKVNAEFFSDMRKNIKTGKVDPSDYINAVAESKRFKNSRATDLSWEFAGPDNIGGRVRAIIVDNVDPDLIYAGGAGGGMYVSTDAAGSWTYKSTDWDNIHVSTIAQDADGIVYAGTGMYADAGSAIGGAFPGGGMWISEDRGATWSHIASTTPTSPGSGADWAYVNRVAVSKVKNSEGNYTVYAATNRGLMVSKDKGATWFEPMTIPNNCNATLSGQMQEVVVTSTNRVLVSVGGSLYASNDGEAVCSYEPIGIANGIGGSNRMSLTVCDSDESIVYAFQTRGANPATFEILSSNDGGNNWGPLSPAPPTTTIDSTFDLMGSNPGAYNQAIKVDPTNCDRIYVGAVELYRVDGSWSSVALNFASEPFYVHSDKHWFEYSPHDPSTMYVGSDGGVGKTTNASDNLVNWTTNNRHFGTTQYYGVAFTKGGQIIGGTQDNGTHYIDPTISGITSKDGFQITGGDGFDCETSNLSSILFTTLYYGQVNRITYENGIGGSPIHGQFEGASPFHTVIRNWESKNDLTSKDSIVFLNDTVNQSIGSGDGVKKVYSGFVTKPQDNADIIAGTFVFTDAAGGQTAEDNLSNGVLYSFGDSVGTISYATGEYDIRWTFAPPIGSSVNSRFLVDFDMGDTLQLASQNMAIPFTHVLTAPLGVQDSVKIQDPVQSLFAVSMFGSIRLTREALYFPLGTPTFTSVDVWGSSSSTSPTCMEFSKDGNHLYIGGNNGQIVRLSGLNDWYSGDDPAVVLDKKVIFNGGGAAVSGINIHPTDPEKLLVTLGGYGTASHVFEMFNAQSDVSNTPANRVDISGDLPDFPVYDPEYNVNNPSQVLIGTELGLWVSDDITAGSVAWTDQSGVMGNVPVLDVRQQRLPHNEAANYGQFYLGTFGRGIWMTGDLVSVEENWNEMGNGLAIESLTMFPNPVNGISTLSFEMAQSGLAEVQVYDISGKLIFAQSQSFDAGTARFEINSSNMPSGTYFATVKAGSVQGQTKFVVIK
ncbi:MAG: T9SS type A sorting domain-containing protein [Salibacteraceae bacterium]